MSISIFTERLFKTQDGLGIQKLALSDSINLVIKDYFGIPELVFEPPLRRPPVLTGVTGSVTRNGVFFRSSGEFRVIADGISFFGIARRVTLKEPDNHGSS